MYSVFILDTQVEWKLAFWPALSHVNGYMGEVFSSNSNMFTVDDLLKVLSFHWRVQLTSWNRVFDLTTECLLSRGSSDSKEEKENQTVWWHAKTNADALNFPKHFDIYRVHEILKTDTFSGDSFIIVNVSEILQQ